MDYTVEYYEKPDGTRPAEDFILSQDDKMQSYRLFNNSVKTKRHPQVSFFLAGAEGLEPSARGFGAKSTLSVKPRVKIQSP